MTANNEETRRRRRSADVAYAGYLWVALVLLISRVLEWFYGKPASPAELSTWQGIGMLVVLPLSISAIIAAVIAGKATLRLWSSWGREWGVVLLPLLLLMMLGAFMLVELDALGRTWLGGFAVLYTLVACALALRWFFYHRQRAH